MSKLTTFKLPDELHKKLKEVAAREGRDMTDIVLEQLTDYIKVHGEGNPAYTLDQFKDPEFKACPAFLSRIETWGSYIQKCNEKELKEIRDKAFAIEHYIEKRFSL